MKYRNHSLEEKLEIVKKIKSGIPMRKLSKEYGILLKYIIEWNRRYESFGEEGLKNKAKSQYYSPEIKCEILDVILKKRVSLPLVAVHYGVSTTTIRNWIKREKGDKVNKKSGMTKSGKRVPLNKKGIKSVSPEAYAKLLKENEQLRVENALLKKVRALVAERENLQD